ncbi:MAG: DUF4212 domain-containing protein [Proteobacteria bacterium]|nr:DUF4212 domain-containing protein [Pseudomonadota bacterium]
MPEPTNRQAYWKANVRIIAILLVVWFVIGFFPGIFFVEQLNKFHLGGFPLGFWFAQQGSIYIFIAIILVYCIWVEKLDRAYHVEENDRGGGE